jgi:membrane protein YdbS with pleckstrin-like domain
MVVDVPGPFDPADLAWTRVSGRLAVARLVVSAVWLLPLLVAGTVVAVVGGGPWLWVGPGVLAALALWVAWLVPRQVRAIGYAERVDDLLIVRGIMFRQLVVVPYGRMQYVDVSAGPIDRWLGIAKVELHTAAASTQAHIAGLSPTEAGRLRERLASRGEARLAGL